MLYPYLPLEHDNEIRLVEIQPSPYTSETIRCEIIHTSRATPISKYEAISYTWGDTTRLKSILIGDAHNFQVTPNCYDVLRRFRKPDATRLIWIDAICINQKDDEERTRQVQEMGEIYKNASEVLVYLGEADESSTRVFRHIEEVCKADTPNHLYVTFNARSLVDPTLLKAKRNFKRRPWFSRVWVLQEVFYGIGSTTVVCGTEAVLWHQLASFYDALASTFPTYSRDVPYIFYIGSGSEPTDLLTLLCQTRYADATDPRDKYFGIISMVVDDKDSKLLANYEQSTTMVYTEIGLHLIKHYGLQLLRTVRHPHSRHSALASWIPDWSCRDDNDPYWTFGFSVRAEYGCKIDRHILECCNDSQSDHSCHPVLSVTGFRAGHITSLGEVLAFEDYSHSHLDVLTRMWNSLGTENETSCLPPGFAGNFDKDEFMRICMRGYDFENLEIGSDKLEGAIHNCRLFLDDHNNLGLAPSEALVGDVLCILEGATEPCLLRQRPERGWFLVSGECYFQEIVDINRREDLDAYLSLFKGVTFGEKENFEIW